MAGGEAEVAAAKVALRRRILAARRALDPDQHARMSRQIAERLYGLAEYREAAGVHVYVAGIGGEVATRSVVEHSLALGKRVLCPRADWDTGRLDSYRIGSLDDLVAGPRGLWEPDPSRTRPAEKGEVDLVVVPGIAFDRSGRRLGFGAGFYDRFLATVQSPSVALAFSLQVVDEVPSTEHDVPVDWIVTEGETIDCRPAREAAMREAMP